MTDSTPGPLLVVRPTDPPETEVAAVIDALAETPGVIWCDAWPSAAADPDRVSPVPPIVLAWKDGALTAFDLGERATTGVHVDFGLALARRRTARDPLRRALGGARTIVDATGGYGDDAIALASAGHDLRVFERHPVVFALVLDAVRRHAASGSAPNLTPPHFELHRVDATTALPQVEADAIYLDPMYPPKRKRAALPRKEIQLLRRLLGPEDNQEALFEAATRARADRWVVKRPVGAAPLGQDLGWKPANRIQTKLVRFDIYTR